MPVSPAQGVHARGMGISEYSYYQYVYFSTINIICVFSCGEKAAKMMAVKEAGA